MRLVPAFLKREVVDEDITFTSLQPAITDFWNQMRGLGFSPRLLQNVWVANRCIQLNAQQVGSMPLRYIGNGPQPAWVTNPDPNWYPNGIGDAVFAATWSLYGWGNAYLYITSRYAGSNLPSAWTVLDPAPMNVTIREGRREYKSANIPLDAADVVHVIRDPQPGGLIGTPALRPFASHLWGALSAAELAQVMMGEGATPNAVLKSQRKLTQEQAEALQAQWVGQSSVRRGAPAVLPPEIDFTQLSFSPRDLLLLEAQEFNARVVSAAFGVPAAMLNMPLEGSTTYENPEILFALWWRTELRHPAKWLADALSGQMLPRGSSVHFDAREVLAPSMAELHKIWNEALTSGAVTVDEYRRAVLQLGPLGDQEAIDELLAPASAGASPADQPTSEVIALRPVTQGF